MQKKKFEKNCEKSIIFRTNWKVDDSNCAKILVTRFIPLTWMHADVVFLEEKKKLLYFFKE